jgi:hypothetical protein
MILLPRIPASSKDFRSGERGLKNGPAVCWGVTPSASPQDGVAGSLPRCSKGFHYEERAFAIELR